MKRNNGYQDTFFYDDENHWDKKAKRMRHMMGFFGAAGFGCLLIAAPLSLCPVPAVQSVMIGFLAASLCCLAISVGFFLMNCLFKGLSYMHDVNKNDADFSLSGLVEHAIN